MTSLPITIPLGYTVTVAVGDEVKAGQQIATPPQDSPVTPVEDDYKIDLSSVYSTRASRSDKFLTKSPGELVSFGDVIAQRKSMLGLKIDQVVAKIPGTMVKFDSSTGEVIIRKTDAPASVRLVDKTDPLLSPLAGKITVCNNDQIVVEGKTSALAGIKGVGGTVSGELMVVKTQEDDPLESTGITREMAEKVLLVSHMTRDALVKASAIGIAGVIGVSFVQEDLDYIVHKNIAIPVIDIDKATAKKLKEKEGKTVVIDGAQKSILFS